MRFLVRNITPELHDDVRHRHQKLHPAVGFLFRIAGIDHDRIGTGVLQAQLLDESEEFFPLVEGFQTAEDDRLRDMVLQIAVDQVVVPGMDIVLFGELRVLADLSAAFLVAMNMDGTL